MSEELDEAVLEDANGRGVKSPDQGGRRKRADRRGRTTSASFPERRWLRHRRDGGDRRSYPFFNSRSHRERRDAFRDTETEKDD